MKTYVLIFTTLATLFACKPSNSEGSVLRYVINNKMTEKEIADLIASANSKNIKLDVAIESLDSKGRIQRIRGNVEFGNSGGGSFASDNLGKIIITQDLGSVDSGFSITVRKRLI